MIKDIVQGAVKSAANWVGTTIGGETGGKIADKITGSLFEKRGVGGDFEVIDTRVTPPSVGGSLMGFKSPGMAGRTSRGMSGGIKTVDADTINAEWNYRLKRYLVDMRYFSRKS
tara:strand:+ start:127 stop:468 length:342 start_codon:yes stop_codon:yes gene_type:complete